MRKLKTSDLFELARCINKIGLKDEIKKIAMKANNVNDIAENGFEIIFGLIEVASAKKAEKPIYEFLSKPFEMSMEEVENLELAEFIKGLTDIADINTWKTFFKTAVL